MTSGAMAATSSRARSLRLFIHVYHIIYHVSVVELGKDYDCFGGWMLSVIQIASWSVVGITRSLWWWDGRQLVGCWYPAIPPGGSLEIVVMSCAIRWPDGVLYENWFNYCNWSIDTTRDQGIHTVSHQSPIIYQSLVPKSIVKGNFQLQLPMSIANDQRGHGGNELQCSQHSIFDHIYILHVDIPRRQL